MIINHHFRNFCSHTYDIYIEAKLESLTSACGWVDDVMLKKPYAQWPNETSEGKS